MDWDNITDNEEVKGLLIERIEIENKIRDIDENALIKYELKVLNIRDFIEIKLTREDLIDREKNTPIEQIKIHHFKNSVMTTHESQKADFITFEDNGEVKQLKNRHK